MRGGRSSLIPLCGAISIGPDGRPLAPPPAREPTDRPTRPQCQVGGRPTARRGDDHFLEQRPQQLLPVTCRRGGSVPDSLQVRSEREHGLQLVGCKSAGTAPFAAFELGPRPFEFAQTPFPVGGGPAGLAGAYRLARLNEEKGGEPLMVAVLKKAHAAGAHMLSGAVLDLSALMPDWQARWAPLDAPVRDDRIYFLTPLQRAAVSPYPAAAAQPRPLRHLAQPFREVARRTGRGGRRRRLHWIPRDGVALRGEPGDWGAHG